MSELNTNKPQVPYATHHMGGEALEKFHLLLSRALDEDATGGAYGYKWTVTTSPIENVPTLVGIDDLHALNLDDFQMVVIDSGNTAGDSWKYIYHPVSQSGTFIKEA